MLHMFELNSIRNQKNQQSKTTHQTILPTLMWWKRRFLEYSRVPPSLFQQGFCKCTVCFFNVTRASWFTAKSWRTLTTWLKIQNLISWNFGYTVLLRFCTKITERGNRRLAGGDSAGQQLVNLQRKKPGDMTNTQRHPFKYQIWGALSLYFEAWCWQLGRTIRHISFTRLPVPVFSWMHCHALPT